jgi:hypothetical protein
MAVLGLCDIASVLAIVYTPSQSRTLVGCWCNSILFWEKTVYQKDTVNTAWHSLWGFAIRVLPGVPERGSERIKSSPRKFSIVPRYRTGNDGW